MRFSTTVLLLSFVFLASEKTFAERSIEDLGFENEQKLDAYLISIENAAAALEANGPAKINHSSSGVMSMMGGGPDETTVPDPYGSDPSNGPLDGGYQDPYAYGQDGSLVARKNGGAELVASLVFKETMKFYGVVAYMNKVGPRVDFKIVSSKHGYFSQMTKLDVAYAIREFGRYLSAYMCGNANFQNFYVLFQQVAKVGLRFKYDMAWALLGNSLPKEPNAIYQLNTRWATFNKIIQDTHMFRNGGGNSDDPNYNPGALKSEVQTWVTGMGDAVSVMAKLGGLRCMTDFRPKPKEEIKKRVVIKKFLDIQAELKAYYDPLKELIDEMEKKGAAQQLSSLK